MTGHATFTVDGEEVDAPCGNARLSRRSSRRRRSAVAKEPNTTVLAIGGKPGRHEISAWEYFFPALPHMAAGRLRHRAAAARRGAHRDGRSARPLSARVRRGALGECGSRARRAQRRGRRGRALSRARGEGRRLRLDPRRPALSALALGRAVARQPNAGAGSAQRGHRIALRPRDDEHRAARRPRAAVPARAAAGRGRARTPCSAWSPPNGNELLGRGEAGEHVAVGDAAHRDVGDDRDRRPSSGSRSRAASCRSASDRRRDARAARARSR